MRQPASKGKWKVPVSVLDRYTLASFQAAHPIGACQRALLGDLILRSFVAASLALIAWHEHSNMAALVAFCLGFFFTPRAITPNLKLGSGRIVFNVRPKIVKYLHGDYKGQNCLEVTYLSGLTKSSSIDLQYEFEEVCAAVFQSCKAMSIDFAEVTAEIQERKPFLGLYYFANPSFSCAYRFVDGNWLVQEE